ncbi:hypothetical protein Goshw_016547 [Gossypium schwendimanii]|uniref:DUF4283 domain-containing protein n=1 Tax=Gossypium schwendimanii TaxID=34291 RepID=A0A7J9KLL3_GOSSC|nr:hypothetical protein [Gossypium schwendimanii]
MLNWWLMGIFRVEDEINYDLCPVGKFLGEKVVKFNAMERTLLALWHPLKGATVKPMGKSALYLIQFYHIIYLKKMSFFGGPGIVLSNCFCHFSIMLDETLQRLSLHKKENVELVLDGDVGVEDEINYDLCLVVEDEINYDLCLVECKCTIYPLDLLLKV